MRVIPAADPPASSSRFLIPAFLLALALAAPASGQNLVQNSRLNVNIDGWQSGAVSAGWSAVDANGAGDSGSLELSNSSPGTGVALGAWQCIDVTPGEDYTFRAEAFLPSGQSETGEVRLTVFFFPHPNCSSPTAPSYIVASTAQLGSWVQLQQTVTSPSWVNSVWVMLDVWKKEAGGDFRARFDDIFFGQPCALTPTRLCLAGNRFGLQAGWRTGAGITGPGTAIKLTTDTGFFWFFSPANVEAIIKVLNGCSLNNRYWVFAAGLTDVKVDLVVTDYETGVSKTYTNPQGKPFQPIQDTDAFATCP